MAMFIVIVAIVIAAAVMWWLGRFYERTFWE